MRYILKQIYVKEDGSCLETGHEYLNLALMYVVSHDYWHTLKLGDSGHKSWV